MMAGPQAKKAKAPAPVGGFAVVRQVWGTDRSKPVRHARTRMPDEVFAEVTVYASPIGHLTLNQLAALIECGLAETPSTSESCWQVVVNGHVVGEFTIRKNPLRLTTLAQLDKAVEDGLLECVPIDAARD